MTITAEEATEFCAKVNDLNARIHAAYAATFEGEPDDPPEQTLTPEEVRVTWIPVKETWVASHDEPWYHGQGKTAREALDDVLRQHENVLASWDAKAKG